MSFHIVSAGVFTLPVDGFSAWAADRIWMAILGLVLDRYLGLQPRHRIHILLALKHTEANE